MRLNKEKPKISEELNSDDKIVSVESVEPPESSGISENRGRGKGRGKENCRKNSEGRGRGQGQGKRILNKNVNSEGGLISMESEGSLESSSSLEVTGRRFGLMMRQTAKQKRKSVASKHGGDSS